MKNDGLEVQGVRKTMVWRSWGARRSQRATNGAREGIVGRLWGSYGGRWHDLGELPGRIWEFILDCKDAF